MTGKDERNELKAKDLAQVSGGNWFKDVVKYATTGVPGVVYDMVSGGGGDSSGGGAIAVSTGGSGDSDGGTNPLQTTPASGPAYTQNNSNNSGAQQNSQNGNNKNEGGMNVTL